jgi:4-amino-4-deoxychorismate lyase
MSRLVETIRCENGILMNISFHNERFVRSSQELFGVKKEIDLRKVIIIPLFARTGIYKCRFEYDSEIRKIEFLPYSIKPVKSLKLLEDNNIEYSYKFTDRRMIESLLARRGECDEILIIKNGMVTDSSYSNIIFRDSDGRWFTPATCLLAGTRRAGLLKQGLISETDIRYNDLNKYSEAKLINAMLGMEDTEGIPFGKIIS